MGENEEKFNNGKNNYTRNRKPSFSRDKRPPSSQTHDTYDKDFWNQGAHQNSRISSDHRQLYNPPVSPIRRNNMTRLITGQLPTPNNLSRSVPSTSRPPQFNHMGRNYHSNQKHQQLYRPGRPHQSQSSLYQQNNNARKYLLQRPDHSSHHNFRKDTSRPPRGSNSSQ